MQSSKNIDFNNPHIRHAARWSFMLLGIAVAAWGAIIPYIKENLNVSEGTLGLLLLCVGVGAILAMPFASALNARLGCRLVLQITIPLNFLLLMFTTYISSVWLCAIVLSALGMVNGIIDIVINIQAVLIETSYKQGLMSNMHGMYSLGNIFGALAMITFLSLGLQPSIVIIILSCFSCAIIFIYCSAYFLPFSSKSKDKISYALPRGIILLIGIMCFLLYMNEGVILDWAALFLINQHHMNPAHASMAFIVFSIAMTIGRLAGDKLTQKIGVKNILLYGMLLAALGQVIIVGTNLTSLSLFGFICVGLGTSNTIPQLFSLSTKQNKVPVHVAISTVTILGFVGLLIGPAIMGFVAELVGLKAIFGLMALILISTSCFIPKLFKY